MSTSRVAKGSEAKRGREQEVPEGVSLRCVPEEGVVPIVSVVRGTLFVCEGTTV